MRALDFLRSVSYPDPNLDCFPEDYYLLRKYRGRNHTLWETPGGWVFVNKDLTEWSFIARGNKTGTHGSSMGENLPFCSVGDYTSSLLSCCLYQTLLVPDSQLCLIMYPLGLSELVFIVENRIGLSNETYGRLHFKIHEPATEMIFQTMGWRMPPGVLLDWLQDNLEDNSLAEFLGRTLYSNSK
jgi:hypothetical protein